MTRHLGDFTEDKVLDFKWYTTDKNGGAVTRTTNGTVAVYKANGTTETTAGITDTKDFDSLTGVHHCRIDTSADAFYAVGQDYQVILQGAVVDGETVNAVIAEFSIENRKASDMLKSATFGLSALNTDLDTLLVRLSSARAGYLDELAAANIPADVDTLLARLTATRAGYLDNLSAGAVGTSAQAVNILAYVDELETRLTAARAGYLDELAAANIPADVDTLLARLTALRAGYIDELSSANVPADVDTLISRLTSVRAGYLDNLTRLDVIVSTRASEANATSNTSGINSNIDANEVKIDAVKVDTAAVKAKTDNLPSDPADESLLEAAITAATLSINNNVDVVEAKVDILDTNLDTVVGKLPVGSIASQADVQAIQNNTRFVSGIPASVLVPITSYLVYKLTGYFYDNAGSMEDPDSNELALQIRRIQGASYVGSAELFDDYAVSIPATASTTFTPSYYKMVREGLGRYAIYVKLASTESPDQWVADFACKESTIELHYTRTTELFDEQPGSVTLADNTTNANIIAESLKERDVSGITAVTGSVYKDLITTVCPSNIVQIDGENTNGYNATLKLKQLDVQNAAGDAIIAKATSAVGAGLRLQGAGNSEFGAGLYANALGQGAGAFMRGGAVSGAGLRVRGGDLGGCGIEVQGFNASPGMLINGAPEADGLLVQGGETVGHGARIVGRADGYSGVKAMANTATGHGIEAIGGASGKDISAKELVSIESKIDIVDGNVDDVETLLGVVDGNVDSVLEDTGTTLPATLSGIEGKVDVVDTNVDAVLVDTGTDIPATLVTIDGHIDDVESLLNVVDGKVDIIDTNVDGALVLLNTVDGKVDIVDTVVDAINSRLPSDPADQSDVEAAIAGSTGTITGDIAAVEAKVDTVQATANLINAKTTNLPSNPTSETNATANKAAVIAEVDANEVLLNDILAYLAGGGVVKANLTQVNGSSTIDGTQIKAIFELVQALVNGRFKKNTPVGGQVTFYKRDNVTPLTVVQVTTAERTRIL